MVILKCSPASVGVNLIVPMLNLLPSFSIREMVFSVAMVIVVCSPHINEMARVLAPHFLIVVLIFHSVAVLRFDQLFDLEGSL